MKRLILVLLLSVSAFAQTRHYPALENQNVWPGSQTFNGGATVSDLITKNSPVVDVRAYGAVCDGSTSDYAAITSALAGGKRVLIPAGLICGTNATLIISTANAHLEIATGAGLKALSGVSGAVLKITASNVTVDGPGAIDANSIAAQCMIVSSTSSTGPQHVSVGGNLECKNSTADGIDVLNTSTTLNDMGLKDITIDRAIVHNTGAHGIYGAAVDGLKVTRSTVYSTTNGDGIKCFECINSQYDDNYVYDYHWTGSNAGNGLEFVFGTSDDIINSHVTNPGSHDNVSGGARNPIYLDTTLGGKIVGNQVYNASRGPRAEHSKSITIANNTMTDIFDEFGIWVNGVFEQVQRNALDTTTGLTAGTGVTLSVDSVVKKEGTGSVLATITSASGVLFYQNFGSAQNWNDTNTNYEVQHIWIYSSVALNEGVLQYEIAASADLSNPVSVVPLQAIPANTWVQIEAYDPIRWFEKQHSILTWGIVSTSTLTSQTLNFDDFESAHFSTHNITITGNTVSKTYFDGIRVEQQMDGVSIVGNTINDAGFYNPAATLSQGIVLDPNGAANTLSNAVVQGNTVNARSMTAVPSPYPVAVRIRNASGGKVCNSFIGVNTTGANVLTPFLNEQGTECGIRGDYFDANRKMNVSTVKEFQLTAGDSTLTTGTIYAQGTASAATAFARGWTGSNAYWDALNSVWQVQDAGAGADDVTGIRYGNNAHLSVISIATNSSGAKTFTDAQLLAGERFFCAPTVCGSAMPMEFYQSVGGASTYVQGPSTAGTSFARGWYGGAYWQGSNWNVPDQGSGANDVGGFLVGNSPRVSIITLAGDGTGAKTFSNATLLGGERFYCTTTGCGSTVPLTTTKLLQSLTNNFAGTIAVSASTTGSTSFTTAFSSAPACTITPTSDPTAVGVWWVTSSTTAVTATVKTSGTITFNYICVGNPN